MSDCVDGALVRVRRSLLPYIGRIITWVYRAFILLPADMCVGMGDGSAPSICRMSLYSTP